MAASRKNAPPKRSSPRPRKKAPAPETIAPSLQIPPPSPPLPASAPSPPRPASASPPVPTAGLRARLQSIALEALEAIPGKIPKAPLNQLTATMGIMFDRIDSLDEPANADAEPLHFSRLTDDQLEQFERTLTILLGDSDHYAVFALPDANDADDPDGPGDAPANVEPSLSAAPLPDLAAEPVRAE